MHISFESTQNKQHYDTKITCTEVREEVMGIYLHRGKGGSYGDLPAQR